MGTFILLFLGGCLIPALVAGVIAVVTGSDIVVCVVLVSLVFVFICIFKAEADRAKSNQARKDMIEQQKKQEKYDNDWGIMKNKDKKS